MITYSHAIVVSGECAISSLMSCCSKELKWWTSVTAQLQLRVSLGKQRKVHPRVVRAGRPQRRGSISFWLPPFIHLSPSPLSLPYANWASQEGGMFVSPEVLTPVLGFSFVPFLWIFPFLCLLATTILDSFSLF